MKFTILTNSDGLLTKRISMEDGKLQKETFADMWNGQAARSETDSFADLRHCFENLATNQAVVHCPHNHDDDSVVITTKAQIGNGKIARTKEFFEYVPGLSVPISFDYDLEEQVDFDIWWSRMKFVWSGFEGAGYVFLPSASGGIYYEDELVAESAGMRIICGVKDASDLPRFSKVLFQRCWLSDFGMIKIGADGRKHARTLFDGAMHQPTRIDFLAGAELGDRLEQDRKLQHVEGHLLDTRALLDLSRDEMAEFKHLVKQAENAVAEQADRVREQWIEQRIDALAERDIPATRARKMIDAQLAGTLLASDVLVFDEFGPVPIIDVLKEPKKYKDKSCEDPNEPEQGGHRAAFRYNRKTDTATVWSYLHGGQLYRVEYDLPSLLTVYRSLDDADPRVYDFGGLLRNASLEPMEVEVFLKEVKEKTGINLPTLRQQVEFVRTGGEGKRTHQEMAEEYIGELGEAVFTDGEVWTPTPEKIWTPYAQPKIDTEIGKRFADEERAKTGSMYVQIRQQVCKNLDEPKFFHDAPKGFACPSGFFYFDDDDQLVCEDLRVGHRARFLLPFDPIDEPPAMLLEFLEECYEGYDPKTQIMRTQELFGGVMTGIGVDFEKAFFALGPENSGKSTMMRVLERSIPEEFTCSVPAGKFHSDYHKAMIAGKLLCTMGEGSDLVLGDDFKSIVGRDKQTARPIYERPFDFYPSCVIVVNANEPPMMKIEGAILRRLETITFPNSRVQSGKAKDNIPNLDQKIISEDQGRILYWALEGARRLQEQNGYTHCATNVETIDGWKLKNDNVQRFIKHAHEYVEHTARHTETITRRVLFTVYRQWCEDEGVKPRTKGQFTQRMTELGHNVDKLNGYDLYRNFILGKLGKKIEEGIE